VHLACYPSSSPMFRSHFLCFFFSPFFLVALSILFFHFLFFLPFFLRTVFFFLLGDAPFSMNWAPRLWCFFATHCVGTKLLQLILCSLASEYVFDCFFGFFAKKILRIL
jgi:hypothetical protein